MASRTPYPRHPNAVILPPPIVVSPLIRTARYLALGLGILWGYWRMGTISERHADLRDFLHNREIIESQRKEQIRAWTDKEQTKTLMKYIGLPIDEGAVQFGVGHLFREDADE